MTPMTIQLQQRLFTVQDMEQMIANGILGEDERVELIDGQFITMSPPGIHHVACVDRLTKLFSRQVPDDVGVSVQNPLATHERTQPEPDVMLLAPRDDLYMNGRATAADVLLLVEVSDSSLKYDEETKLPLYAAAGVREVWIVNLQDHWIDCYSDPAPRNYRLRERFFAGDTIHPDALPKVSIDVGYILNPLGSAD
ncbi:MAG: Uma2 family endonuclease [Caldilineaceae bacterium]